MQGIGPHFVGASWVMHRLCWLCIFNFGLVRAFLNLGPSCWTNCLVLYAFAHKKEAAWNKTFQVKDPFIVLTSSCHLGLLTRWEIHLGLCRAGGEWAKERQNRQKCWSNNFPPTSQAQRTFLCLGCPVLVHGLH